ncbi:JmjC domain-containing protein [Actinokineospora sp. HUAS TT18]|uniref:JmjC domain-containing protein n=1 Tax=Actinokineospora sp. HUAS TT18 TaxID=3447451 RepID=UPI003F520299
MSYLNDPVWADLFAKPEQAHDIDWGRASLRFMAADTVRSLVTRPLIERWMVYGNLRYPQLNVSYGGEGAPPTTFTRSRRLNQHQLPGTAHADDILTHLRQGATLVLSNPELWDEATAAFCHNLARPLAAAVQCYAYLTAPDRFGSKPHRDEGDVFAIQIEGTKEWTLYDLPTGEDWYRGHIDPDAVPREKITLEPGDALYVPAGMGHRAQAGPEGSLHLTVSLQVLSVQDVVAAWAAQAGSTFSRHERLPMGSEGRVDHIQDALRRLAEATTKADAASIADALVPTSQWPTEIRRLTWE